MAITNAMEIANLKTIEEAFKLIDTKKESLKRAYDDLQAHSSLLSSFSLSWADLDSHFNSLQTNLRRRFNHIQSLHSSSFSHNNPPYDAAASDQPLTIVVGDPSSSSYPPDHGAVTLSVVEVPVPVQDPTLSNPTSQPQTQPQGVPVQDPSSYLKPLNPNQATHPELFTLCEKMDGQGLRNYINDHAKERESIRTELLGLMGVAPDPGAMVLDAMKGFYSSNSRSKGDKDMDLYRLRKSCLDVLEVLTEIKPNLSNEVKERAKKLAFEWKGKVNLNGDSPLEALGFLNLIVAYGLENEFDAGELLDYFVVVARFKQATVLCRSIGLGDKTTDLVQKLIDNGKQLLAVKFIFEFGLTDKFQPVPLLKDHLQECKKITKDICKDGKNSIKAQNEVRTREVNALKSVLKVINEHKLDSDYPKLDLEKRIEMLEKQKADKKVGQRSPDSKPQQQAKNQHQQQAKQQAKKQQLNGNKRSRLIASTGPAAIPVSIAGSSSTLPPFPQSHLPPAGLLPAAGPRPYGLVGSTPPIASYAGASAGPYGLAGAAISFPGNPSSAGALPYSSDPYMPSGYYDRPSAYGGYGLPPQYHSNYYPQ